MILASYHRRTLPSQTTGAHVFEEALTGIVALQSRDTISPIKQGSHETSLRFSASLNAMDMGNYRGISAYRFRILPDIGYFANFGGTIISLAEVNSVRERTSYLTSDPIRGFGPPVREINLSFGATTKDGVAIRWLVFLGGEVACEKRRLRYIVYACCPSHILGILCWYLLKKNKGRFRYDRYPAFVSLPPLMLSINNSRRIFFHARYGLFKFLLQ